MRGSADNGPYYTEADAIDAVIDSIEYEGSTDNEPYYTEKDFYVVWFAYILGDWKALVSTNRVAGVYWEVTYNEHDGLTYVDRYIKMGQVILEDGDEEEEKK